ncbi:MAG: EscU/YscU/HrcU family type III secretion system export apparatus switch protein, partial [Chlamydiales bacterium]|nr:EscU/YscU/HrcU family type III secretion system export apparatus switch protein [Chlamydiales bacterium]
MAEKTEQATPKKMREARKKGQVAKSQDFPSAFTFIVSISVILLTSAHLYEQLGGFIISMFRMGGSPTLDLQNQAGGVFASAIMVIFNTSLPILLFTTGVGLLVNAMVVGPLFSFEALKPDLKRLNPVSNIKNMFKFKTIFELLKSLLKISGAIILIYSVVWDQIPEIIATASLPPLGSALVFSDFLIKVVIRVG